MNELLGAVLAHRLVLNAAIRSHPALGALLQRMPLLREQGIAVALAEPAPDEVRVAFEQAMDEIEQLIQLVSRSGA